MKYASDLRKCNGHFRRFGQRGCYHARNCSDNSVDNWVLIPYHLSMTNKTAAELKLTAEQVQMVDDWRALDAEIAKLTAERDAIVGPLQDHVERHGALVCTHRGRIIAQMVAAPVQYRVSTTLLKKELPDIAAKYTKPTNPQPKLKYVA